MVQIASFFFPVYAIMIILSRPFTGRLFDRYGERIVIYPSILLFVIGLIALSQAHYPSLFLAAAGFIGLGFGTLFSTLQVIAIKRASMEKRGLATGTWLLFFDIGVGIGSYILGWMASSMGYQTMYMISSIIVVCSSILYYVIVQRKEMSRVGRDGQSYADQVSNH